MRPSLTRDSSDPAGIQAAWPRLTQAIKAGIRGSDQFIGSADQTADDCHLLAGPCRSKGFSPNRSGTHGNVSSDQCFRRRVVIVWFLQRNQVPQGPGDLV